MNLLLFLIVFLTPSYTFYLIYTGENSKVEDHLDDPWFFEDK